MTYLDQLFSLTGKPGPVFQKLLEAWKELVGLDFVAQAHDYARRLLDWEQQQ